MFIKKTYEEACIKFQILSINVKNSNIFYDLAEFYQNFKFDDVKNWFYVKIYVFPDYFESYWEFSILTLKSTNQIQLTIWKPPSELKIETCLVLYTHKKHYIRLPSQTQSQYNFTFRILI